MMCRGTASLVTSSNAPCSKSLYVMLSSSRNVAFGSAAWTSLHKREGQCRERQHAEPAGMGAAPNAAKRRVDPEAAGICRLAGNESEGSFGHSKQG